MAFSCAKYRYVTILPRYATATTLEQRLRHNGAVDFANLYAIRNPNIVKQWSINQNLSVRRTT